MQPQPRYKKGDKIGGRYLVHQALMGGMGEVYLCLDLEQNLPLALKTFQARFLTNQKLRQAFEREVATWVALEKHPNIVRCYYMDRIDNQPFMILDWIASDESHGTDLRSWLSRGPLDFRLALDFAIDICRGLIHAGQKQPGLVHRDLKPENILVDQGRVAKITDFGLAKMVQDAALALPDPPTGPDRRQHLSNVGGTPPYMAPEQWEGEALDCRTDIYALGCILFEMLTGKLPFPSERLDGLRRQHLQAEVPALTQAETLPTVLNPLLTRCLAKQRKRRFASADGLLEELSAIYQRQFAKAPRSIAIGQDFTATDYNNRGNTYQVLRRYDEALADYAQALRLDTNHASTYHNRGLTYAHLRRYDEALADYNQALRLDPNDAQAFNNRGNTYIALGRAEEALADYTQALRIDPNLAQAYSNRGLIYAQLRRYDEALSDYTQALRIDPNLAQAYSNRGNTYLDLRRYDEALAEFTQALRIDPNFALAYCNRGGTYADLGRYDEALADYAQVLRIEPDDARVHFILGALHANRGDWRMALPYFEKAAQLGESMAAAYAARAREMLGIAPSTQPEPAQEAFEAFQQANAKDEMRQAVARFPALVDPGFLAGIEQFVVPQVPPDLKRALEQRLAWLRQIATEQ